MRLGLWAAAGFAFAFGICAHVQGWPNAAIEATRDAYHHWPTQFSAWSQAPLIPVINVDVKFKHMATLEAKRQKALKDGVLVTSGDDFVPASLRVDGQTIPVKIRLKGDWTDHLSGDKWSLRIKTRDDEQLWGMRSFSLQHPSTRSWDGEWLYHRHLQMEGVLGLRYRFVEAKLNGDDLGIFAVEEHFSKELLESQQRREGVIIKPDEGGLWERRVTMRKYHSLRHEDLLAMNLVPFGESTVANSPTLNNDAIAAIEKFDAVLRGELLASQAFHVERTAKFLAVTELWSADHALAFHNFRLYYDPLTGLLEPIGFDANPLQHMHYSLLATESDWTEQLLNDPKLLAAYCKHLKRMTAPDYLKLVFEKFHQSWNDVVNTLQREWPEFQPSIWSKVEKRRRVLKQLLDQRHFITGHFRSEPRNGKFNLEVELTSAADFPIEVRTRWKLLGSDTWEPWSVWDLPQREFGFSSGSLTQVVAMEAEIREPNGELIKTLSLDNLSPTSFDLESEPINTAMIAWDAENETFRFTSRLVVIDSDVFVPQDEKLTVDPGTTIEITEMGRLACENLNLLGSANEPIEVKIAGALAAQNMDARFVNYRGTHDGATFQSRGNIVLSDCSLNDIKLDAHNVQAKSTHITGTAPTGVRCDGTVVLTDCQIDGKFDVAIFSVGGWVNIRQSSISNANTALAADHGCYCELNDVLIANVKTAIQSERFSTVECKNVFINAAERGLVCGEDEKFPAYIDCVRLQVGRVKQLTKHWVGSRITIDKQVTAPTINKAAKQ
jgi:hypothetical protein